MTDLTRKGDFANKKTVSIAAASLLHSDVSDTALQELFVLPANCLIVASYCVAKAAGQALLTADFGFAGGAELGSALDIDAISAVEGLADGTPVDTGTGKTVTAKFSADPSAGEFVFIVEYIEYTLGCGTITNYA